MTSVAIGTRRLLFTLALIVVLVLLLVPASDVPSSNDKVSHLLTFAALALLGRWASWPLTLLVPFLLVYAGLSEIAQATLTTTRHGDWRDAVADACGIGLGVLFMGIAGRLRPTDVRR